VSRLPSLDDVRTHRRVEIVLVVAVWAGIVVPLVVDSLTTAKGFTPITGKATTRLPEFAGHATTASNAAIVLVCAAVTLLALLALARRAPQARRLELRRVPVLIALLAPWIITVAYLVIAGRSPGAPAVVYPAVAVAFWALRPGPDAIRTVGLLTGLTAALSIVLGVFDPAAGRYPAEAAGLDKAIGAMGVLAGVMPTGNNLGVVLVLGLAPVLTIRSLRVRLVALGLVLVALAWTSSRTSWVAAVVVAVVLIVVRVPWRRTAVVTTGLAAIAVVGLVIPFITHAPTAFVNRAGFWIASLDAWREHVPFGYGADYYKRLADTPDNLGGFAYQAHNEWVQLLVTGGVLLALVVVVLLVIAGARAVRAAAAGTTWGAGWLAALLTVSVLEVPLGFVDRMMFLPFTLVPLCLLVCSAPVARAATARSGGRATSVLSISGPVEGPGPETASMGAQRG